MSRMLSGLSIVALASTLLAGCSTLEPPSASPGTGREVQGPSFEDSNAGLIDKTLSGLAVANLVAPTVNASERVIVVSMEDTVNKSFSNYNYLIEDNIISNLLSGGVKVLERDENMIVREVPEAGDVYNRSMLRLLPTPPSIALMDAIEKNGLSSIFHDDKLTAAEFLSLYKQINEDYKTLVATQNHMQPANVIVSYRLIELGIRATTNKIQSQVSSQKDSVANTSTSAWTWQISRESLARIFVRVMDAKTGEIRAARILQNQLSSKISLAQDKGENDSDFDARANSYLASLSKYHYSWYEQQLPNKNGNPEPKDNMAVPVPPPQKGLF